MIWGDWIRLVDKQSIGLREQRIYQENASLRSDLAEPLARLLSEHHRNMTPGIDLLGMLGYPSVAAAWTRQKGGMPAKTVSDQQFMPAADTLPNALQELSTRQGNFGEVLVADFSASELGFEIPIKRLSHNPNPHQSMKGDDALGIRRGLSGEIDVVLVGESKFRDSTAPSQLAKAVSQGHDSLAKGPKSMDFVAAMLEQQGRNTDAQLMRQARARLAANSGQVTCLPVLMLITVGHPADPFGAIAPEKAIPNLVTVNLQFERGILAWLDGVFDSGDRP